jgi:integrator complex subunit 11
MLQEFGVDCYTPANGETSTIPCSPSIPVDVSLPLLKAEARTYNLLPPDPKRQRILHGVLVMKDNVSHFLHVLCITVYEFIYSTTLSFH